MTTFYVSPSSLSYRHYKTIVSVAAAFGWTPQWVWPRGAFHPDVYFKPGILTGALKGLAGADIFIALIPGTCSTSIEIGMAYTLCEELFLVARDPVHFTQTGLSDAHLSALPGIKRVCCELNEIPEMLKKEYMNLIDPA